MAQFHNILFPFDFSEAGEAMAAELREIASRCDAALTVLHSFNVVRDHNLAECLDPTGVHPKTPVPYEPSIAILRKQAQWQLTAFANEEFPNLTCHVLMEDGDPATVIRIVAKRDNIDLIMMPTKGLGTFRRMPLGSVAAKALHDSSCAAFTSVHECDTRRPKRSGYRAIVCAVELNEEAESILQTAAGLAQLWGGQLSIVHVVQHHTPEAERVAGEELAAIARRTGLTRPLLVVDSGVPNGIRQVASQQSADLVVVGRGKDQATISRVWSHLYEIVRESPCPVLSV